MVSAICFVYNRNISRSSIPVFYYHYTSWLKWVVQKYMIILIITMQRMDFSILRKLSLLLHYQIYEGVELS